MASKSANKKAGIMKPPSNLRIDETQLKLREEEEFNIGEEFGNYNCMNEDVMSITALDNPHMVFSESKHQTSGTSGCVGLVFSHPKTSYNAFMQ